MATPAQLTLEGRRIHSALDSAARIRRMIVAALVTGVAIAAIAAPWDARLALLPLAIVLGSTQLIGVCGLAHLGALGPLSKLPAIRKRWIVGVAAYTVAGATSAAVVGAALGWIGLWLLPAGHDALRLAAICAFILTAVSRELGWLKVRMPDARRQTHPDLVRRMPFPVAWTIWGLHLGLTFTTWMTVPGPVVLGGIAIVGGQPAFAAVLFAAHWFGRTVPIWSSPAIYESASETSAVVAAAASQRGLLRVVHLVGLLLIASVLFGRFFFGGAFL